MTFNESHVIIGYPHMLTYIICLNNMEL